MNKEIKSQVSRWAKDHLGEDFVFRPNQLETIVQIIDDKINNNIYHHIIQAPTGSGKSLINIISAGVLWTYYNQKSYILCSDLYLYKQYQDFIDKHNLEDFKYLKGQTGNYYCQKSNLDSRTSICKMAGISYKRLFDIINNQKPETKQEEKIHKLFSCAKSCPYLLERIEAVEAPITLMTYHLFYFQMNVCSQKYDSHGNPIPGQFLHRDQIFCDECHNIPMIMQSRCRPTIKYDDFKRMTKIFNFYKYIKSNSKRQLKVFDKIPNDNEILNRFKIYWKQMLDKSLDSYNNTITLLNYTHKLVDIIATIGSRIQGIFGTKVRNGLNLNDKEKEIYQEICWLQNYHCYLDDFARAIEISGFHYTYKQIQNGPIVNFGTVKEDGIIYLFLLNHGLQGTTLTSATIGNINSFKENCGYKYFEEYTNEQIDENHKNITNSNVNYINIPSNFNFDYSPIYIDLEDKMTFKNKKKAIIPITNKINKILFSHQNENGIIQTGSYENAQNIYNLIDSSQKHRILIYKNTQEKKEHLSKITKSSNFVIIGPSLNEGIDLPGELCTFIIIAKIPYLSLADKYVTSKMKIFKKWYNETTANNIIQGIGRGNRFENDWSSIYILDGCFKRLYSYTKKSWPSFITSRFEYGQIDEILRRYEKEMA